MRDRLSSIFILSGFPTLLISIYMSHLDNNRNLSIAEENIYNKHSGMVGEYKSLANGETKFEPLIIYGERSVIPARKYKPVVGATKRKPGRRLSVRPYPKDKSTEQNVFIDRDGVKIFPDGTNIYPDGIQVWANGKTVYPDAMTVENDGVTIYPDGTMLSPDGTVIEIQP